MFQARMWWILYTALFFAFVLLFCSHMCEGSTVASDFRDSVWCQRVLHWRYSRLHLIPQAHLYLCQLSSFDY